MYPGSFVVPSIATAVTATTTSTIVRFVFVATAQGIVYGVAALAGNSKRFWGGSGSLLLLLHLFPAT